MVAKVYDRSRIFCATDKAVALSSAGEIRQRRASSFSLIDFYMNERVPEPDGVATVVVRFSAEPFSLRILVHDATCRLAPNTLSKPSKTSYLTPTHGTDRPLLPSWSSHQRLSSPMLRWLAFANLATTQPCSNETSVSKYSTSSKIYSGLHKRLAPSMGSLSLHGTTNNVPVAHHPTNA